MDEPNLPIGPETKKFLKKIYEIKLRFYNYGPVKASQWPWGIEKPALGEVWPIMSGKSITIIQGLLFEIVALQRWPWPLVRMATLKEEQWK